MDELDKAIQTSRDGQKPAAKAAVKAGKTKTNPLVRSAITSVVRNVVGHVTRALLKELTRKTR